MSAPIFDIIQWSIKGRDFGLDRNGNLYMRGSKIVMSYDLSPVELSGSSGGGAAVYSASVTATLGASQNNYAPTGISASTTRLLLAAAAGGSTMTGLDSTGVVDGATRLIVNTSATDSITFSHLSSSSTAANRFSCPNGGSAVLEPLAAAFAVYVVNQWKFA